MKEGLVTLIPEQGKDPSLIDNWRSVMLLYTEYKLIAFVLSNRLKFELNDIIN